MRVELPDHPPPPCTLYPFRVWSFRPRDPFFCRGEGPVHENFLPVEQGLFIELVEQGVPDFFQHARGFPLDEPPPASARRGKPLRQVSPAGSAAKHPYNAFETGAIIGSGASSSTRRGLLRNEWSQTLPLCVGQQYFRSSCHHTAPSKSRDNRTHAIAQLYVNRVLKPALDGFVISNLMLRIDFPSVIFMLAFRILNLSPPHFYGPVTLCGLFLPFVLKRGRYV